MFDALSFGEIEDQHVELLPARTVLSMIRVKSGGGVCVGGAGGTGGNGGEGSGGLGVNANYTYIQSKGLPNSFLQNGLPAPVSPNGVPGNLPLEQLSKHNVNVTVFYEKGPISLRAAYNWRSRFLLTSADVIFPYYPIYNEATGQLDGSAFYSVTKNIKVGVQGVNLLNEVTKTSQQFTASGLIAPRSYFVNDRRYSFIVRGTFGGSSRAAPPPPPPVAPPPPPETQTCPDGSVVAVTATCPVAAPPPPPPPAAKPERG